MTFIPSVILVLVVVGLIAVYLKMRQRDQLDVLIKKRQPTSKVVSRAEYVEGMEKIPVALALTADTFYYENPDLEASFELSRVDEIEYDDELAIGKTVDDDRRVMRLRCHGTAFEFILAKEDVAKWTAALPARRMGEPATAQAV